MRASECPCERWSPYLSIIVCANCFVLAGLLPGVGVGQEFFPLLQLLREGRGREKWEDKTTKGGHGRRTGGKGQISEAEEKRRDGGRGSTDEKEQEEGRLGKWIEKGNVRRMGYKSRRE